MVIVVNYADGNFKKTQAFNTKTAKKWGADKVISFGREDIDAEFATRNAEILKGKMGGGFFLWKPYFIKRVYETMSENDYLFYSDSGAIFVNKIQYLIDCMDKENVDIMLFSLENEILERKYTKRDIFILMDCDSEKYAETPQILAGYMILKKTDFVTKFLNEWLEYAQDERLETSMDNTLGLPNYEGFVAHRTQSIPSLLAKKYELKVFRDPSQFGLINRYPEDVEKRSTYPQIIDSHRMKDVTHVWQIKFRRTMRKNKYIAMLKQKVYDKTGKTIF